MLTRHSLLNKAMPTYEYYCPDNQRTVEVMHGMSAALTTWGEVCAKAEIPQGKTPSEAPVDKLLGAGMVIAKSRPAEDFNCGNPGGCCGGGCKMG